MLKPEVLPGKLRLFVVAAHSIYKEHMALLIDCLVAWSWANRKTWSIAADLKAVEALRKLLDTCRSIREELLETPYKMKPPTVLKVLAEKTLEDPVFRATLPNTFKYLISRRTIGSMILNRILRRSY